VLFDFPAQLTPFRFLQLLVSVELLLSAGEDEFLLTVDADEDAVVE
jgi:hypothetical protein